MAWELNIILCCYKSSTLHIWDVSGKTQLVKGRKLSFTVLIKVKASQRIESNFRHFSEDEGQLQVVQRKQQ